MFDPPMTEERRPDWLDLASSPILDVLTAMNAADAEVAPAVARALPQIEKATAAVVGALDKGGSLVYVGAGTSGRLGVLDAAECPPTFHTPPDLVRALIAGGDAALRHAVEGAEDDRETGARDLAGSGVTSADAVAGISASGRTPYVLGALEYARRLGAVTIGISCSPGAELSGAVEFPIEAPVGAEIVAGSTRLRAGTATKLILNMLSTAAMIKLGYTYGGLMVNVQPTNKKLEERACRIIRELSGVPEARARELLDEAGRSVPVAILMGKTKLDRAGAERRLARARGRLGVALEDHWTDS